jgi:hypothetical protein
MEFEYTSFNGRLVLNPTDFILRLEDKDCLRVYERTFLEREFAEYGSVGGIHFVENIVKTFFQNSESSGIEIKSIKKTATELSFTLSCKNALFVKPLEISFSLPAVRITNANPDTDVMARKLKEVAAKMEYKFADLTERLQELERRCGDTITLPGCDYAIPVIITSLTLVRNGVELQEGTTGYFYSSFYPGFRTKAQIMNNIYTNPSQPMGSHLNSGYCPTYEPATNSYVFHTLTDLTNLKYLTKCTTLTIVGCNELIDYNSIGQMKQLTSLVITSSRKSTWTGGNPQTNITSDGTSPKLTDVSWIQGLKELTHISFLGCSSLVDITPLGKLGQLKTLDIRETGIKNTSFLNSSSLTVTTK